MKLWTGNHSLIYQFWFKFKSISNYRINFFDLWTQTAHKFKRIFILNWKTWSNSRALNLRPQKMSFLEFATKNDDFQNILEFKCEFWRKTLTFWRKNENFLLKKLIFSQKNQFFNFPPQKMFWAKFHSNSIFFRQIWFYFHLKTRKNRKT